MLLDYAPLVPTPEFAFYLELFTEKLVFYALMLSRLLLYTV